MPSSYTVLAGDCISSIAYEHGFFPDTIWQAPENESLRQQRPSLNVLAPGDTVVIPDKRPNPYDAQTGLTYRFRLKGVPEKLRVRFLLGDQPRANETYTIKIDGVVAGTGQTIGDGEIAIPILPSAKLGTVTLGDQTFQLNLGRLDPVAEVQGAQMRLQNLGYYAGPIDGTLSPETEEALAAFQVANDLDLSGELDDATQAALIDSAGA
ncbi:MAG: peptidoglycan-binding domain-containing protein [Ignavibacteriota bacterium]